MPRKLLIFSIPIFTIVLIFSVIKLTIFEKKPSLKEILNQEGYTELNPPSRLVPPGTWVNVIRANPLHLGVICPPQSALGMSLEDSVLNSTSADKKISAKLENLGEFSVGAISSVEGSAKFSSVDSVSLQMKNVRIIELPDSIVMQGILQRDEFCRDAIRFRIKENKPISMIKSALIADIHYQIKFQNNIDNTTKAELQKKLALELDLRLKSNQMGGSYLVGQDLIWGVREDASLAMVGFELPSTGGTGSKKSVFNDNSSINKIVSPDRSGFDLDNEVISYNISPLRQSSQMSCWATVYTMMKAWKDKKAYLVNQVVSNLGAPWDDYYVNDTGLPGGKEREFVNAIGMKSMPPANYTLEAYVDLLKNHGPIWIITGDGISSHARLLVGIYGNYKAEGIQAYEETTLEFIDPLLGSYSYINALKFMESFEKEARWLVDGKLDDIEFRDQILFWPQDA